MWYRLVYLLHILTLYELDIDVISIRYIHYIHEILTLYSWDIDIISTRYWHYIHEILTLYPRDIDIISTRYWHYIHEILTLYPWDIDIISMRYKKCWRKCWINKTFRNLAKVSLRSSLFYLSYRLLLLPHFLYFFFIGRFVF